MNSFKTSSITTTIYGNILFVKTCLHEICYCNTIFQILKI